MTDNTNAKRPTHTIFKVLGHGGDARWIKVGVAFPHKDGLGLALVFDGIPVDGRIVVRENRATEDIAEVERGPETLNQAGARSAGRQTASAKAFKVHLPDPMARQRSFI